MLALILGLLKIAVAVFQSVFQIFSFSDYILVCFIVCLLCCLCLVHYFLYVGNSVLCLIEERGMFPQLSFYQQHACLHSQPSRLRLLWWGKNRSHRFGDSFSGVSLLLLKERGGTTTHLHMRYISCTGRQGCIHGFDLALGWRYSQPNFIQEVIHYCGGGIPGGSAGGCRGLGCFF